MGPLLTGCTLKKPNILVITADDMRYDHVPFMPQTQQLFGPGREFTACRQNVALCQPHRIGFLKGQYAKRNGVYTNTQYMAQASESLGPWMQQGGYSTALVGKYPLPFGSAPLAGWNVRRTLQNDSEQNAYGYGVYDGSSVTFPTEYQSDYLFDQARGFVTTLPRPWFCWLTPTNPHVGFDWSLQPRPEDLDDWLDVEWPIVDDDMVGKPSWMQGLPPFSEEAKADIRDGAIGQLQELRSVDDGIASLFAALAATNQLSNTIVIFTSDNGVMYGEHRIGLVPSLKNCPYEPSMHVPLLARGPGFVSGSTTNMPACAQDITATCLAVAKVTPSIPIDGRDLRTNITGRVLLHERVGGPVAGMPNGVGVSTSTRKLWRHDAEDPDRYEMYLLDTDPNELVNVAYAPSFAAERAALEAALDAELEAALV